MVGLKRLTLGSATLAFVVTAGFWGSAAQAAGPCAAGTPQYCPTPVVTTGPTTSVTSTTATLTGTVNPGGVATSCAFGYGLTTSYGTATPLQSAGSGTTVVNMSAAISGLSPSTTYHYVLVCVNAGAFAAGKDMTFRTASKGASKIQIKTSVALVDKNGNLFIKITCNGNATCIGTVSLTSVGGTTHATAAAAKLLAPKKKFTIGAHKTKKIKLKLKKKVLNQLKKSKSHKRKARLTVKTKAGAFASKKITLKLKK